MALANNSSEVVPDNITSNVLVQVVFYILYSIIFMLGLSGNLLVCYIVYYNKSMQTVTNLFITNLALSDILLCLLAVPFTPLYTFIGRWIFGEVICHLVPYAQATSVYVSTLTLAAIAIDRYFVILHPLRQRMKITTCLCVLFGIWTFSLLITLPYGIWMQMKVHVDRDVCEETWPIENLEKAFGTFTLVMQFVVPFCIIAFCYLRISQRLNQRAKTKPGSKTARKEEIERERKRRTNRMLIAMVAIFGFCWFPLNLINVINDFYAYGPYFHLMFFLAHAIAMSSTCYNPFLYAWLNENFRKEFKQFLPCMFTGSLNRFRNGDEHTLDTLLHPSAANNSPAIHLEPREPTAERITSKIEDCKL
ncbi:prolactin-releasing peptide receptor-like [Agrilus planipennis]|uniref:Prolactin-releasing peptide receptor-like n=1 Tax=Agrilus planipennis TaxID=224129 RepID=A0A1W4WQR9_AGRPL|nr:prolactin-releasing peptide receptor-like [Agrilus planipennis]XP_018322824.1 prolactin-releasing peptide receptor-like [Agrilus planipennis]